MEHSKWRPSPGTILGLLALVVALAGTAIAGPLATTSVLSKGEKKQVRKIAKGQVKKLAPGLAVASAKSAANAGKLDGLDASDFTPAGEVHNSGRVVLNDPAPGLPAVSSELFVAGPFTIRARCVQDESGPNESAALFVAGPAGSSFTGTLSNGTFTNANASSEGVAASVLSLASQASGGHITAVAPSGQVMSVSASVEVNDPAGDCVFGVTAIGP